jgi:hypothetical protein
MVLTVAPPQPEGGPSTGKDAKGGKGAPALLSRELAGSLQAGHRTFEWLQAVFVMVMAAQKTLKPGEYLWELVHPKDKDGNPTKNVMGKYKVKLYIMVRQARAPLASLPLQNEPVQRRYIPTNAPLERVASAQS